MRGCNKIIRRALSHENNLMFNDPDKDGEPIFFNNLVRNSKMKRRV